MKPITLTDATHRLDDGADALAPDHVAALRAALDSYAEALEELRQALIAFGDIDPATLPAAAVPAAA